MANSQCMGILMILLANHVALVKKVKSEMVRMFSAEFIQVSGDTFGL